MPEDDNNNKDNKEFEFIKEQVIQKKSKNFKKWLTKFFITILLAILFGLVVTVVFCVAEPKFYKYLHKEENNKTPVSVPTTIPQQEDSNNNTDNGPSNDNKEIIKDNNNNGNTESKDGQAAEEPKVSEPSKVIVQRIDANLNDYLMMYDDIKEVISRANKSIVTISSSINEKDWFGSSVDKKITTTGLIVQKNSLQLKILVSLDRIKDASRIKLELADNISVDAVLKDYDEDINLAILDVDVTEIPPAYLSNITAVTFGDSYSILVGSPVLALGSPNGYPGSVDYGIITSKGSTVSITDNILDLFNTNMMSNNNGDGIIINFKGEVIGLLTRTLKEGRNENLCTAINISKIKTIIDKLVNQKPLIYCGVIAEDMTVAARKEHNVLNGIYVNEVKANSPAFNAGIKGGDIILTVNDEIVLNTNNFYDVISENTPGTEVKFKIMRTTGTTEKEVEFTLTLVDKNKKDKKD